MGSRGRHNVATWKARLAAEPSLVLEPCDVPHSCPSVPRLTPTCAECGENCGGEQELHTCGEPTRAVPAVIVEEFPAAQAQLREDVLEVRRGARCSSERHWIEWASPHGEKEDARKTAADLEPTRPEVSVRKAVARDVENRPQNESRKPRAAGGAGRCARRHVEGNYHGCLPSRMLRPRVPSAYGRR